MALYKNYLLLLVLFLDWDSPLFNQQCNAHDTENWLDTVWQQPCQV